MVLPSIDASKPDHLGPLFVFVGYDEQRNVQSIIGGLWPTRHE
jgi:hypothetical protein